MATINIVKIKVRRGTDVQRKTVVFDNGELAYVTDADSRRLFIGDGVTTGGAPAGMKFYTGSVTTAPNAFARAQVGDFVYDTLLNRHLILSGVDGDGFPDFSNLNAYQNITIRVDNNTIRFNPNRLLSVVDNGLSARHISTQAFDINNGFLRGADDAPFRVNIDGTSLKFNVANRQIFVDPRSVAWNLLPTTPQPPGSNRMWIDTTDSNRIKVAL
jgi:hypothetical protein